MLQFRFVSRSINRRACIYLGSSYTAHPRGISTSILQANLSLPISPSAFFFHLLSHHTVVWGVFSLLCFCLLFLYGYGFLSGGKKIGALNFARVFDYYPDSSYPILVNSGSRGVTAAALLLGGAI